MLYQKGNNMELVFRKEQADFFEEDQFAINEKDLMNAVKEAIDSGQMLKSSNLKKMIETLIDTSIETGSNDWSIIAKVVLAKLVTTTDSKAAAATFRAAKAQVEELE